MKWRVSYVERIISALVKIIYDDSTYVVITSILFENGDESNRGLIRLTAKHFLSEVISIDQM